MSVHRSIFALVAFVVGTAGTNPPLSIDQMKWHNRILLSSASTLSDPRLALQRRILSEWQQGASDRDITFVELAGQKVDGTTDTAAVLRKRYGLSSGGFQSLLIGKDGHVALRSTRPIDANTLQGTIDAMPMRQQGER